MIAKTNTRQTFEFDLIDFAFIQAKLRLFKQNFDWNNSNVEVTRNQI